MSATRDFLRWLKAIYRSALTRQDTQALQARFDQLQREWLDDRRARDERATAIERNHIAQQQTLLASLAMLRTAIDESNRASDVARDEQSNQLRGVSHRVAEMLRRIDRFAPELPKSSDSGEWTALAFADAFRGSYEEIESRLEVYLPDMSRALRRTSNSKAIDVGCGRGEWLAVLRKNGIDGFGIDESVECVNACLAAGLDARVGDAIALLRAQADSSVAAVTAFHVVEHMPYGTVAALMVEAFRVLCPGGSLIIETPNCENVAVGANTFWLDPTHVRPYPLKLLEFMVVQAGFVPVDLLRLHPNHQLIDDTQLQTLPEAARLMIAGPQDGAIVAMRKVD